MEELENLFKNRKINILKLLEYGFIKENNNYVYKTTLIKNEFDIIISIDTKSSTKLNIQVIDLISNEEYLPIKVQNATGEYVGKVKEACKKILQDIINECSQVEVFKTKQAKQVIEYVKKKYNNEPEFLWKKYDDNAVFRHSESKKWYGVLLTVQANKLGLESDEVVEIIDLKILPENMEKIVDNNKYFLGYHMNKKHWFTIIFDNGVPIEEIYKFIDESYNIK